MSTRLRKDTCLVMYTLRHSRKARLPYTFRLVSNASTCAGQKRDCRRTAECDHWYMCLYRRAAGSPPMLLLHDTLMAGTTVSSQVNAQYATRSI
jgi:hypothetical protein